MKALIWIGSSLDDLKDFPDQVMDEIGYSLYEAQMGLKPINSKPLTGISNGVIEIISNFDKNTYRAVYTVKIGEVIYVLHCFQKKSKTGIATPKHEIDLIKQRLNQAKQLEMQLR
jgi:phage-related protein